MRSCDKTQSLRGTVFRTMVFLGDGFMRIQMAYVGSSLSAYGFRLLTSIVRRKNPETACSFVMFYNVRSIAKVISPVSETAELTDEEVGKIAREFSDYDVLGIGCMSEHAAR
jgi:hypothetical protein